MKRSAIAGMWFIFLLFAAPLGASAFHDDADLATRDLGDRATRPDISQWTGNAPENKQWVDCTLRQFLLKEIGLSQEQAIKMKSLTTRSMQRIKRCRIATKKINEEKINMFLCGRVDKERLEMLDEEYLRYHSQLVAERLKLQRKRVRLLTEDQVKRLGNFLAIKDAESGYRKASK